jgi:hypothetical protein
MQFDLYEVACRWLETTGLRRMFLFSLLRYYGLTVVTSGYIIHIHERWPNHLAPDYLHGWRCGERERPRRQKKQSQRGRWYLNMIVPAASGFKIRRQAFCELLVRMRSARCEAWYTATETDKAQGRLRQLCYPGLRVHRVDVT